MSGADRKPPQNIEAEKAVLGAMLIKREAITEAQEMLRAEDFYREAHRIVYGAIETLFTQNEAVDIVTLTEELRKEQMLDKVGGISFVTDLANTVPTAANLAYHAKIVQEKAELRRLIDAATEIAGKAYEDAEEVADIMDDAEKKILAVAANQRGGAFEPISNILMDTMGKQAKRFGADIRRGKIAKVDFSSRPFLAVDDRGNEIFAQTVIIATGATAKYLGLPSEQKFKGLGVSACATCDGFFYRKKDVAVVGGGDTACEEATYLAGLCKKVYMIVRRDVFRASVAMQDKVRNTPNIEILWNCNTQEVLGDENGVTGVRLLRKDGKVFDIKVDGFFLAIGHHPNSDIFKEWIDTDENGYILTGKDSRTNVEGVFAAGDVQDPHYRQAITAAASGCRAALDVERFLIANNL